LEALHRRALPILAICIVSIVALIAPSQASASWQLRYYGRFTHGINRSVWTRYNGTPRCCPQTLWKKSHVVVKGGILRLQNYRDPAYGGRWVSGGVSMGRSLNQTYGRYRVRFRMTKGRGVGMCLFLWPKHGWPPEIDFAEESSGVGGRRWETSTLHFGSHNTEIHHRVHANFTKWHTIGVNWTPGKLLYVLDGHVWARVTGSHVPNVPMHLGLQTHVGTNGQTGPNPTSSTPRKVGLQIDWVKISRYR
jgi:beta-glucanase (GH16 family)